jgi:hypothetical protein
LLIKGRDGEDARESSSPARQNAAIRAREAARRAARRSSGQSSSTQNGLAAAIVRPATLL